MGVKRARDPSGTCNRGRHASRLSGSDGNHAVGAVADEQVQGECASKARRKGEATAEPTLNPRRSMRERCGPKSREILEGGGIPAFRTAGTRHSSILAANGDQQHVQMSEGVYGLQRCRIDKVPFI